MGMSRKIAIPALVGMLLFTGANGASAAPNDSNKIEQSKVVETSPRSIDFENVIPGTPQTKNITIKNVSGKDITIRPQMDVGDEYSSFLETRLQFCDNGVNCVDVTPDFKMDISRNASKDLALTVNFTQKPPTEFLDIKLNGGLKIVGEVYPDDPTEEILEIVPDSEMTDDDSLASTGVGPMIFKIMGGAGFLVILGYILFRLSRQKDNEPQQLT